MGVSLPLIETTHFRKGSKADAAWQPGMETFLKASKEVKGRTENLRGGSTSEGEDGFCSMIRRRIS